MRDPAAIHPTGLGLTLANCIADHATLADFPTPGITGRLAKALDTEIVYRDNASSWQAWVTPSGGGGGGGGPPTDWVRYTPLAGQTGLAMNSFHHVQWDDSGSVGIMHGGAIILNGSRRPQVTEDGWYTLSFYMEGDSDGAHSVQWRSFATDIEIGRGYNTAGDFQDPILLLIDDFMGHDSTASGAGGAFSIITYSSGPVYMLAGAEVDVRANMVGTVLTVADTWSLTDSQFNMEKLPL